MQDKPSWRYQTHFILFYCTMVMTTTVSAMPSGSIGPDPQPQRQSQPAEPCEAGLSDTKTEAVDPTAARLFHVRPGGGQLVEVDHEAASRVQEIRSAAGAAQQAVEIPPSLPSIEPENPEAAHSIEEMRAMARTIVAEIVQKARAIIAGQPGDLEGVTHLTLNVDTELEALTLSNLLKKPLANLAKIDDVAPQGQRHQDLVQLVQHLDRLKAEGEKLNATPSELRRRAEKLLPGFAQRKLEERRSREYEELRQKYIRDYMTIEESITFIQGVMTDKKLNLEEEVAEFKADRRQLLTMSNKLLRSAAFGFAVDEALLEYLRDNTGGLDPNRRVLVEHAVVPLRRAISTILQLSVLTHQSIKENYLSITLHRRLIERYNQAITLLPIAMGQVARQQLGIRSRAHAMEIAGTIERSIDSVMLSAAEGLRKQTDAIINGDTETALKVATFEEISKTLAGVDRDLSNYFQKESKTHARDIASLHQIVEEVRQTLPALGRAENISESMANLIGVKTSAVAPSSPLTIEMLARKALEKNGE